MSIEIIQRKTNATCFPSHLVPNFKSLIFSVQPVIVVKARKGGICEMKSDETDIGEGGRVNQNEVGKREQ